MPTARKWSNVAVAMQSAIGLFSTPEELQQQWEDSRRGVMPADPAIASARRWRGWSGGVRAGYRGRHDEGRGP